MNDAKQSVLIAGFTTRHVAKSAKNAGFRVFALDNFCDQDLFWYVDEGVRFEDLSELPSAIEDMCTRYEIDGIVLTSGAEDLRVNKIPRIGTSPDIVAPFLDKRRTQQFFTQNRFPVPSSIDPVTYPAILKPCRGAGGWRNVVIQNDADLRAWEKEWNNEPYLLQEIVNGIPASVCCVCDGRRAQAIAVNQQILRGSEDAPFGFAGSLTPFSHPLAHQMATCAEAVVGLSGCKGVIGVDFIVSDENFFVIEINPRFQATLDTVEMAMGCNLFMLHCDACNGILPSKMPVSQQVAVRTILFARHNMRIDEDLSSLRPLVADIPYPGTIFLEGQAVISVYGWGENEETAWSMLNTTISRVTQYMR